MRAHLTCLLLAALVLTPLGGCDTAPAPRPDYRVRLIPSPSGKGTIAIPPECPSWAEVANSPFENEPWPQYGCAHARNLASMVERPEDLIDPKQLGSADPTTTASAVDRYRVGKTKALIDPNATSPVYIATPTTGSK